MAAALTRDHLMLIAGECKAVEPLVLPVEGGCQRLDGEGTGRSFDANVPVLPDVLHVERELRDGVAPVPLAPQLVDDLRYQGAGNSGESVGSHSLEAQRV